MYGYSKQIQEGQEKAVKLTAAKGDDESDDLGFDDPEAVRCMIDFLYLDDYDSMVVSGGEDCEVKEAVRVEDHSGLQDIGDGSQLGGGTGEDLPPASVRHAAGPSKDSPLLLHSKMYALGSKYDVGSLQATALRKFNEAAKTNLEKDDLAAAIPIVFNSTPESDTGLRCLLLRVVLNNLHDLLHHTEFVRSIDNTEGLVLQLLKEQTYSRFTKKIACRVCGTSKARPCNGSSNRNRHSYVACDCDEDNDGYCESCSKHW